eukprot:6267528-Prymnesium_polylepis.1
MSKQDHTRLHAALAAASNLLDSRNRRVLSGRDEKLNGYVKTKYSEPSSLGSSAAGGLSKKSNGSLLLSASPAAFSAAGPPSDTADCAAQ